MAKLFSEWFCSAISRYIFCTINYSIDRVLSMRLLYLNPEFVLFVKQLLEYEEAIITLHKELNHYDWRRRVNLFIRKYIKNQ